MAQPGRFAILFTDVVNSYLSDAEIAMTEGPMLQKFFGTLQLLGCVLRWVSGDVGVSKHINMGYQWDNIWYINEIIVG